MGKNHIDTRHHRSFEEHMAAMTGADVAAIRQNWQGIIADRSPSVRTLVAAIEMNQRKIVSLWDERDNADRHLANELHTVETWRRTQAKGMLPERMQGGDYVEKYEAGVRREHARVTGEIDARVHELQQQQAVWFQDALRHVPSFSVAPAGATAPANPR